MRGTIPLLALFSALISLPAFATEHLVVVGGGAYPPDAISRFVEKAGGADAHILCIVWASSDLDVVKQTTQNFEKAVRSHAIKDIEISPPAWEMEKQKSAFLNQLDRPPACFSRAEIRTASWTFFAMSHYSPCFKNSITPESFSAAPAPARRSCPVR